MKKIALYDDYFFLFTNKNKPFIHCDICDTIGNISFYINIEGACYEFAYLKYFKKMDKNIILKIKDDYQRQLDKCLRGKKEVYRIFFKKNKELFKNLRESIKN